VPGGPSASRARQAVLAKRGLGSCPNRASARTATRYESDPSDMSDMSDPAPDTISHPRQASRSRQSCIRAWSVRSNDSGITVTAGSHSASTSVPSAVWANSMPLPFGQ